MKLCIQGLPRSIVLLAVVAVSACGGGTEPVAVPPTPSIKATAPAPVKKATTVTGGNAVVIHMYQALYRMAPSNELLLDYAFQANNDASTFVKNLTDRFATTSHADLAKLVLDNLGVTASTVPAINAKGDSEYALLLDAVKQIFGVFPTMRGQVILNMTDLLAGLESDATYGTAAIAYNTHALSNFRYSINNGVELFASTPIPLPDLRPIYSTLCGIGFDKNIIFHKPILLDLNNDGRIDIIASLGCLQNVYGVTTLEPIKNRLIAFLQQSDGSFFDATKEIFGTSYVDIGGAYRNAVVYDFNGDGYDDIALAVNKEDGRLLSDTSNNIQNSYLISSGAGKYSVGRFGTTQWGYDLHLMDNEIGTKDVIATPIGYGTGPDAWKYLDTWQQVQSDYRWVNTPNSVIFKRRAANEGSRNAITGIGKPALFGLSLYTRSTNSNWSRASELALSTYTSVPWKNWDTSTSLVPLITLDGQDYVNPVLQRGCEIKVNPAEESGAVMVMESYKLPTAKYDGSPLSEGVNMTLQYKMVGVSISNGKLTRLNIPLKNELTSYMHYLTFCEDVNKDGYDDIVVSQISGRSNANAFPLIYINDKKGNFALVDQRQFPKPADIGASYVGIYVDINNDGISDLVYWPLSGVYSNSNSPVQIQIFKGLRNANESDLQ